MDYRPLGRTGLKTSQLILGTMNFGHLTDEPHAFSIMDHAIDSGITVFDTADVYGGPQKPDIAKGFGISEEIIGRWMAHRVAGATRSFWRQNSISPWAMGRMTGASRPIT